MERNIVYVYAFGGMADWEIGYLTAELASGRFLKPGAGRFTVRTFSAGREPVTTMGGLHLLPDIGAEWVRAEAAALLVLPGGDSWLTGEDHGAAIDLARKFLSAGIPVAAICGATAALAREGLLDERAHTSNASEFLSAVAPAYRGAARYRDAGAVRDGNLITASGLAPLEFARETLAALGAADGRTLEAWYELNRTRSAEMYFALMASLSRDAAA